MQHQYNDSTFASLAASLLAYTQQRITAASLPAAANESALPTTTAESANDFGGGGQHQQMMAIDSVTRDISTLVASLQAISASADAERIGRSVLTAHVEYLKNKYGAGTDEATKKAVSDAFDYLLSVTHYEDGGLTQYEIKDNCTDDFLTVRVRIGDNCRFLFCSQENRSIGLLRSWWIAFTRLGSGQLFGRSPSIPTACLRHAYSSSNSSRGGNDGHAVWLFHADGEQVPQYAKRAYSANNYQDTADGQEGAGGMWACIRSLIDDSSAARTSPSPVGALSNEALGAFIVAALDARSFDDSGSFFEAYDDQLEEGKEVVLRNGKYGLCNLPLLIPL